MATIETGLDNQPKAPAAEPQAAPTLPPVAPAPTKAKESVYIESDEEDSALELEEMGEHKKWIRKPIKSWKIRAGSKVPKKYTFTGGNYAEIYRGKSFIRFAPFLVKNDIESDNSWAQFTTDDFYGKNPSPWPWDWTSIKILWIPLDKSENFCETMAAGGFKIRVDESSKGQLPLYLKLTDDERQKILKNNRMVGMALLLKANLNGYEKPKTNWWFWGIIALIAIAAVSIWALWQIGAFQGLINWINGISHSLSIPSPPGQQ